MKFDFDDILIEPVSITNIDSRSEISIEDKNHMLPLFTAPMFDVIDENNMNEYLNNKVYGVLPRKKLTEYTLEYIALSGPRRFISMGLVDFEKLFIESILSDSVLINKFYILIDIANGHMSKLVELVRKSKKRWGDRLILMVGNIANPETYHILSDAGADFIRIGIGNGSGCLTTEQSSIGYPMASLIKDIHDESLKVNNPAKIIADGGMKKYADIIKALALGANYVMLGGMFNKALESASPTYTYTGYVYEEISKRQAKIRFNDSVDIYKKFRGMSSKSVQKELGNKVLKTSEGISTYNKVEYTLEGWIENFNHYLKSAMSYTGKRNLKDFIGRVNYNMITYNAFKRYNK